MIVNGRFMELVILAAVSTTVLWLLQRKQVPYIRRVPGLDAIEEGVGRATEMDKPVLYSYGLGRGGITNQTLASLSILDYVAGLCARSDTQLVIPSGGDEQSYIVRPIAVDIVRNAYVREGKADEFDADTMIPFFSGMQFAYGMSVVGLTLERRPACYIYIGSQGADALMMCEAATNVGSYTIAHGGYAGNMAALACAADYLLIGEEVPAAGAYLSKDEAMLSTLRVQDLSRMVIWGFILVGAVLAQIGIDLIKNLAQT
jgi:hypothetical protein